MRQLLYLGMLLLMGCSTALAQADPSVRLEVDIPYDTVGLDETFEVTLTAHNTEFLGQTTMPAIEGLEWLPGHGIHHHTQMVNGVQTASMGYSYRAKANRLGIVIIPAMELETKAGYLVSPERIVVVLAETPPRPRSEDDFFGASPFSPLHSTPSPFGEDMEKRMNKLRQDMQELQERSFEERRQRPSRPQIPKRIPKSPVKRGKTYRI